MVQKQEFMARFSNSERSSSFNTMLNINNIQLPQKPLLEEFIKDFGEKVKEINENYKDSKIQF
jgi:phage-related protein